MQREEIEKTVTKEAAHLLHHLFRRFSLLLDLVDLRKEVLDGRLCVLYVSLALLGRPALGTDVVRDVSVDHYDFLQGDGVRLRRRRKVGMEKEQ